MRTRRWPLKAAPAIAASCLAGFATIMPAVSVVAPLCGTTAAGAEEAGTREYSIEKGDDGSTSVWIHLGSGDDSLAFRFDGDPPDDLDSLLAAVGAGREKDHYTVNVRRTGRTSGDVVRVGENVTIGEDEKVMGDAVAVGGTVRVRGHVSDNVVAVGGNAVIESTAVVGGDVVAVGGRVKVSEGAVVRGEKVSVGIFGPGFAKGPGMSFGWGPPPWLESVIHGALFLGAFLFAWLIHALSARRLENVRSTLEQRFFVSLVLGLLAFPAAFLVGVLLVITIIGIPAAIVLPLIFGVLTFMGFVAVLWSIGRSILGALRGRTPGFEGALGFGLLLLFVFLQIEGVWKRSDWLGASLFGYLLFSLLAVISFVGMGAVLLSRVGSRGAENAAAVAAPGGAVSAAVSVEGGMPPTPGAPFESPPPPTETGSGL